MFFVSLLCDAAIKASTMALSASKRRQRRHWESTCQVNRSIFVFLFLVLSSEAFSTRKWSRCSTRSCCGTEASSCQPDDAVVVEQNTWNEGPVGIYVHIPYCRRRCRYCDVAIVPIGNNAATTHDGEEESAKILVDERQPLQGSRATRGFLHMDISYRTAIVKELDTIQPQFSNTTTNIPLQTIYFGGGTPSLAPIETLETILSTIITSESSPFSLQDDAEVTIEMDPGTFSLSKLEAIRNMGFNRISLGVQSFSDHVLESIGRFHRRQDIYDSIALLHQVYGTDLNYSLDLISGLPGVSLGMWAETLETATTLEPRPKHLSLYDLQVESGTVFGKWYDENNHQERGSVHDVPRLPSPQDCAFAYKYASSYLRAKGYEHYEISSYAFKGQHATLPYRSRHNQIYWQPTSQWFAVGLGATSSINGSRFARPRAMADYISWVQQGAPLPPQEQDSQELDHEALTDIIMTRLRTSEGLDLDWIQTHVGPGVVDKIQKGAQLGLDLGLALHDRSSASKEGILRLVDPDGFLFSNSIISSIFVELEA